MLAAQKREQYKINKYEEHIGYFNVDYIPGVGRQLSADLFKPSESFILLSDANGHVSPDKFELWLIERIVPQTRIGIDKLLADMGLSEYDELGILKYTEGQHASDTCTIDFSATV